MRRRFALKDTQGYNSHKGDNGDVGKTLVLIGLVIAGFGLLMMVGLPIGRLPGDFYIRRGNFSFYFPLASSIIVSIILTLLLAFFRR